MGNLQVPSYLSLVREEMFLAFYTLSPKEEAEHLARARELTKTAVQSIQGDIGRQLDWTEHTPF